MWKLPGLAVGVVVSCIASVGMAGAFTLKAADGSFTAEFPSEPKFEKSDSKTDSGIPMVQSTWIVESDTTVYMIMTHSYSEKVNEVYDPSIAAAVATVKGKLIRQTDIVYRGLKGREAFIDDPDDHAIFRIRLFWIANRLHNVMYAGPPGTETSADVQAFMDSFQSLR